MSRHRTVACLLCAQLLPAGLDGWAEHYRTRHPGAQGRVRVYAGKRSTVADVTPRPVAVQGDRGECPECRASCGVRRDAGGDYRISDHPRASGGRGVCNGSGAIVDEAEAAHG